MNFNSAQDRTQKLYFLPAPHPTSCVTRTSHPPVSSHCLLARMDRNLLAIAAGCCCCIVMLLLIAPLFIWVWWVMYDTYTRGVTEISCAHEYGIWEYLILLFFVGLAMSNLRTLSDIVMTFRSGSMDAQTIVKWRGVIFLVSWTASTIVLVWFISWGTRMWQRMPAECTVQYEQEFPDLLLLFHICKHTKQRVIDSRRIQSLSLSQSSAP